MADISKVVVRWDGFPGAPGYTVLYGPALDTKMASIKAFFEAIKGYLSPLTTISYPTAGYVLDPATGVASGVWGQAGITSTTGATGGAQTGPAGACVTWRTSGLSPAGHLVKGRTFLVPMAVNAYATDGTLVAAAQTAISGAAAALIAACPTQFHVWHRPVAGAGGASYPVLTSTLNPKIAVLTSRRD